MAPGRPLKSARRVLYDGTLDGTARLDEESSHKILHVLRLGIGDQVSVVDSGGKEWRCSIEELDGSHVVVVPIAHENPPVPLLELSAYIALVKGERMDDAIEKVAEAGAGKIVPFIAERSVVKTPGAERIERWRRIAKAAALQSGHGAVAEIEPVIAGLPEIEGPFWYFDFDGIAPDDAPAPRSILIGPEGGWTDREREVLRARGTAITLGPATFRTESAAFLGTYLAGCRQRGERSPKEG